MSAELTADRAAALTVACGFCLAQPGQVCVRKGTTDHLVHLPAHLDRLTAAGVVHAPLGPEPQDIRW